MDCSGCGFQIESGFAFCPKCGVRQPVRCSSCGFPCAPDFAFCPKCGAQHRRRQKPHRSIDRLAARMPPPLPDAQGQRLRCAMPIAGR